MRRFCKEIVDHIVDITGCSNDHPVAYIGFYAIKVLFFYGSNNYITAECEYMEISS